MRLFIGLPFGEDASRSFEGVQNLLKQLSRKGNFTAFENFHLTLAFLGEQSEERIPAVFAALDELDFPPLDLTFTTLGRFDGGIWYLFPAYNETLFTCQAQLAGTLSRYGFDLEDRPYIPHVTLGRKILLKEDAQIEESLYTPIPAHSIGPRLFLSHRVDGVLRYDPLEP